MGIFIDEPAMVHLANVHDNFFIKGVKFPLHDVVAVLFLLKHHGHHGLGLPVEIDGMTVEVFPGSGEARVWNPSESIFYSFYQSYYVDFL